MIETINIIAISILGAQLLLVFAILYLIDKSKTKKIQEENELLRNILLEYRGYDERLIKIERYLQKTHNLTFDKIESLIKQEIYRKSNVIEIRNYLKPKK